VEIKNKFIYLLVFLLLNNADYINSQDSFNNGILPKLGTNFIMAKAKLYPKIKIKIDDLGQSNWDISAYNPNDFDTIRLKKPKKTRFGAYFPESKAAIIINSNKIQYVYEDSGKVFLNGLIDDYMEADIPVLLKFKDRMLLKNNEKRINVEYENIATSSFCAPFYRKIGTDSIRADIEVRKIARVDAKGWLTTPLGKYKTYREVSFFDKRIKGYKYTLFGWEPTNEYSVDRHYIVYKWYSEKGGLPIAVAYINEEDYVEEIHYLYNSPMRLFFIGFHVSCKYGGDGKIDLRVEGGIPDYKFEWSNGIKTENLINVKAGTYRVKVTDNRGRTLSGNYTVTEPLIALNLKFNKTDVTCNSAKNGKISVDIKGGKTPYDFTWSNDSTTWEINGLYPDYYGITVTDANYCTIKDSIKITEPENKLRIKLKVTDISCLNGADGQIAANVTGGTQPYTYKWSNNDTSKVAKNLKTGNYSVTVTDKNACTKSANIFVSQPRTAINIIKDVENVSCFNGNNGKIELLVRGGKPPYKYLWQDSTRLRRLKNIKAGAYKFTLTDNNNCVVNDIANVTQPSMPLKVSASKKDINCFGNNTGEIQLTVNGGTQPYNYSWSNNETKKKINKLKQGFYYVKITDKNLCEIYDTIKILAPNNPLFAKAEKKNIKCKGGNSGEIQLQVSGGTKPYSFLWSNNKTKKNLKNLKAGKHNVVITDKNNCELKKEIELTQAQTVLNVEIEKNNVICFGSKSGSIYLSVSGGVPPYTYIWNNNKNKQNLIGIAAGNYKVIVSDENLCQKKLDIEITQPKTLKLNAKIIDSENNKATGSINLIITGGTKPYKIYYNGKSTTNNIDGLKSGIYTVVVTDANDCETTKKFEIK